MPVLASLKVGKSPEPDQIPIHWTTVVLRRGSDEAFVKHLSMLITEVLLKFLLYVEILRKNEKFSDIKSLKNVIISKFTGKFPSKFQS